MKKLQFFVFLLLCSSQVRLGAEELRIAVASNFYSSMQEIARLFEQESPHKLVLMSGSSAKLYSQILHGAPFDMFFSADSHKAKSLEALGLIVPQSRFTYAIGQLVLLSSQKYPNLSLDALKSHKFSRLIYANPSLAPYGLAAQEVLDKRGVGEHLQHIQAENVNQALIFLLNTDDAIGFVAMSQILAHSQQASTASWHLLEKHFYSPIIQQAVTLKPSQASQDFVRFLRSDTIQKLLKTQGYLQITK